MVSQKAWGTPFKGIPYARECPAAALEGMPEHLLQKKEQAVPTAYPHKKPWISSPSAFWLFYLNQGIVQEVTKID